MKFLKNIFLTALLLPVAGVLSAQETKKPTDSGIPDVKPSVTIVEESSTPSEVPLPDKREHVYKIPPEIEAIKQKEAEEAPKPEGQWTAPQRQVTP